MNDQFAGLLDAREDDGDWFCMECDRYVRLEGHRPECPQSARAPREIDRVTDHEDLRSELMEDCLGDLGFRVKLAYTPYWTNVTVWEITSRDAGNRAAGFDRKGAQSLPDVVYDTNEAEVYLEGHIKWDGCSELDQGCPHWCGPRDYKKHIALLEWLYRRAQDLMEAGDGKAWDEP